MLCGDPYSVENVLGPLLSHQQCYLSGDRSLTLETQFCDSKRKVEVILSSYHSAMDFRDELIHGFILVNIYIYLKNPWNWLSFHFQNIFTGILRETSSFPVDFDCFFLEHSRIANSVIGSVRWRFCQFRHHLTIDHWRKYIGRSIKCAFHDLKH